MGSMKITLCASAAVVAAVLIPTAYASGEGSGHKGGSVSITPSTPTPGGDVTLRVSGCGGRTATASSNAFVADAQLVGPGGSDGTLAGDTRVRSSIGAGTYDVQIICVDFKVKGRIKVVTSSSAESSSQSMPSQSSRSAESAEPSWPSAPASPVAPVHAGGGGTAAQAAADEARVDGRGPGTVQAVVGLVLAGVAAAAVVFRGVHRRRRAE